MQKSIYLEREIRQGMSLFRIFSTYGIQNNFYICRKNLTPDYICRISTYICKKNTTGWDGYESWPKTESVNIRGDTRKEAYMHPFSSIWSTKISPDVRWFQRTALEVELFFEWKNIIGCCMIGISSATGATLEFWGDQSFKNDFVKKFPYHHDVAYQQLGQEIIDHAISEIFCFSASCENSFCVSAWK